SLSLPLSSFFFSCFSAHLALHSFPTRRSSDLYQLRSDEYCACRRRRHADEFPAVQFTREVWSLRFACHVSSRRPVLPDQVFQVCRLRIANVRHLLRSGNLPLNGDRAAIVELPLPFDNSRKIHFALADGDLLAKFPRVRRPHPILRVDSLDIRAEEFNGVDGISLP